MPTRARRIAFLGGGTMAEAMIRGLVERRLVPASNVTVTGPRREFGAPAESDVTR